jgi:hypothetical protein
MKTNFVSAKKVAVAALIVVLLGFACFLVWPQQKQTFEMQVAGKKNVASREYLILKARYSLVSEKLLGLSPKILYLRDSTRYTWLTRGEEEPEENWKYYPDRPPPFLLDYFDGSDNDPWEKNAVGVSMPKDYNLWRLRIDFTQTVMFRQRELFIFRRATFVSPVLWYNSFDK